MEYIALDQLFLNVCVCVCPAGHKILTQKIMNRELFIKIFSALLLYGVGEREGGVRARQTDIPRQTVRERERVHILIHLQGHFRDRTSYLTTYR